MKKILTTILLLFCLTACLGQTNKLFRYNPVTSLAPDSVLIQVYDSTQHQAGCSTCHIGKWTFGSLLAYLQTRIGGGSGTVTSVGLTGGNGITIGGTSPITTSGTFTAKVDTSHNNNHPITQKFAQSKIDSVAALISNVTPAALTKTNDTNVTLTLGGTPATALLQATSLTLGWTGTLADGRISSASTWNAKQNAITTGTTSQYLRGDLSLATFPTNVSTFINDAGYLTSPGTPSLTSTQVGYGIGGLLGSSSGLTYDLTQGLFVTTTSANVPVLSLKQGSGMTSGNIFEVKDNSNTQLFAIDRNGKTIVNTLSGGLVYTTGNGMLRDTSITIPSVTGYVQYSDSTLKYVTPAQLNDSLRNASFKVYYTNTFERWDTLLVHDSLPQGYWCEISDRADGGIYLYATSKNTFSLGGYGIFLNADYQNIGSREPDIIGIWSAGLMTPTANTSIAIYNGKMWLNLTGSVGGNPENDATNWQELTRTILHGYIKETDNIEYDFKMDWLQYRSDKRGNTYSYSFSTDTSNFQIGHSAIIDFQWGRDSVYGNTIEQSIVENSNYMGTLFNNNIALNSYIDSTNHLEYLSGIYGNEVINSQITGNYLNSLALIITNTIVNVGSIISNQLNTSASLQNNNILGGASIQQNIIGIGCAISNNALEPFAIISIDTLDGSMSPSSISQNLIGNESEISQNNILSGALLNNNDILANIDISNIELSSNVEFYQNIVAVSLAHRTYSSNTISQTFLTTIAIGTGSPDASAKVDITSTTQGFLPPRMTTTQRLAIVSPAEGLHVYDNTLHSGYYYNGSSWVAYPSGGLNSLTGTSGTPTIAAGVGAGTSPTVSVSGTNIGGIITVTTGTIGVTTGIVATITYNGLTFGTDSYPILYPDNAATALLSGTTMVFADGTTGTFVITSGAAALTPATTYKWNFAVTGK